MTQQNSPLLLFNVQDGSTGTSAYLHIRYSNSSSGNPMLGPGVTGKYIGIYTDSSPSDSSDYTKYKWSQIVGEDGTPGTTITGTEVKYAVSTQGTTPPSTESDWKQLSETTVTKGQYLWTRTKVSYSSGSDVTSYSVTYVAKDGTPGNPGTPGAPGRGISSTEVLYGKSSDGSTQPTVWEDAVTKVQVGAGEFLWTKTTISYTSGDPSISYSVSRNGADGKVDDLYLDVRYSNDLESKTFTGDNGHDLGLYIGFYLAPVQVITPVFDNYSWSEASKPEEESYTYDIVFDRPNIWKFFTSDLSYSYTPASLNVRFLKYNKNGGASPAGGTLSASYTYLNSSGATVDVTIASAQDELSVNLVDSNILSRNIQYFSFVGVIDETQVAASVKYAEWGTSENMAKLALNATNITAAIDSTKLIFNTNGLEVRNGGLTIYDGTENKVFYATSDGDLYFTGELHSSVGSLGGWTIDEYGLTSNNGKVGLYSGNSDRVYQNDSIRIWAGQQDDGQYNFAVTQNGMLLAQNADITGVIRATGGTIANRMLVGSADHGIVIYGGANSDSFISSSQFASGESGYGWKISENGDAEFNNATIRGKIVGAVFEYNRISAIGGSLYVAPTIYTQVESAAITYSSTTQKYSVSWAFSDIDLQNFQNRTWAIGDEVKIDGNLIQNGTTINVSDVTAQITSTTNNVLTISFSYGSTLTGGKFNPGVAIILYGTEAQRNGLYLTAVGANAPYMDVYNSETDNTIRPAVRIGNLSGVVDANFPSTVLSGYGLYSSNAYLRGQLMLPGAGITNQNSVLYEDSPIRIWAGLSNVDETDITQANFIVTANGSMYAKQGIFEGTVKATNSEFSGTIRAAGIVINENVSYEGPEVSQDHFFVGYVDEPTSYNDYVLNISANGLSIWEGGLRAFSDFASGENDVNYRNPIYGYYGEHTSPMPYFSLADDGEANLLNARIVAYKGHFMTISDAGTNGYQTNSVIVDNGLWFAKNTYNTLNNIEHAAFYTGLTTGISLLDTGLTLQSETYIGLRGNGVRINSDDMTDSSALYVNGQVKIVNEAGDNIISLGQQVIKEHKDSNGNSIGFDIIVR